MPTFLTDFLSRYGVYFLMCMGASFVLAALLLIIADRQMRGLDIPEDADFVTTMQHTPFFVVIGIDLLDFALDILAMPIVWVILGRFRLRALRNISVIEAFVPGTQLFPTLTICWISINILGIQS